MRSPYFLFAILVLFSCSPAITDDSPQTIVPSYIQESFDALRVASQKVGGEAWLIKSKNVAFDAKIENDDSPINQTFARIPGRFIDGQAEYAALVIMPGVAVIPNDNYHALGPAALVAIHSLPDGAAIEPANAFTFGIPVTAEVPNSLGSSQKVSVYLAKSNLTGELELLDQSVDAKFAISERAVTGTLVPVSGNSLASGWVNYKVENHSGDLLCSGNIDFKNTSISIDYITEHYFQLTAIGLSSVSIGYTTPDPQIPDATEVVHITSTFGEPRSMTVTCESGAYDLGEDSSVSSWGMVLDVWDWKQLSSDSGECAVTCTTKKGLTKVKGDFNYLGYNTVGISFDGKFEGLSWTNPD